MLRNIKFVFSVHFCCCCSVAKSCPTLCDHTDCSMPDSLSSTISQSLLNFMSIESVMSSNHLVLCCPFLLLPSNFPSIRVFSSESVLHIRWPKYWSFSINPSNKYSGLISFRMYWLDLLAVQGTLKSLHLLILQTTKLCGSDWHSFPFIHPVSSLPRRVQLPGHEPSPGVHRTHAFPPGCPTARHPVRDPATR